MVFQYRPNWGGTTGGPGVTVFNARKSSQHIGDWEQDFADIVRAFFVTVQANLPNELVISFPAEVLEFDTSTGTLINAYPVTPPGNVPGTNASGYAMPAGARIDWFTPAIVAGRRLRGRTYLVPINGTAFDTNGTLVAGTITNLGNAADGLIDDMNGIGALAVWSRTHGILADVETASVIDKVAILRSRRD